MSFSLFHEKSPDENPTEATSAQPTRALHPLIRAHGAVTGLALALLVVLIYGIHERSVAASSSAKSAAAAVELKDTRAQISALNAKLDALVKSQQAERPAADVAPMDEPPVIVRSMKPAKPGPSVMHTTGQRQKPDPRWKKVQAQLDAQGKQIDEQGKQIASARQEISSTRSDLEGSIAKTHDELVVLQKKGERNYVEFDLDKSKHFHTAGPVGISLRKASTKDQYADLKLLVDDREVTKKHLNLYEPVIFYLSDERQAVELVVNSITKNHVRGYISAPKYKASELAGGGTPTTTADRHKLEGPR
jgi:DNA repair exonuclease SbcCD ATPase subunit